MTDVPIMTRKEGDRCFHHVDSKQLRKQGYPLGGCVIRWGIQCAGTPDRAYPKCPGYYIPWEDINKVRKASGYE